MNYSIICRFLSLISLVFLCAFILCWSVDAFFEAKFTDLIHGGWATALAVVFLVTLATRLLSLGSGTKIFRKEGLAAIGLGWILAASLGALPYWTILPNCSFADAFFESASGLTTTGATVFPDVESFSKGLLLWRSLSQWIGGLGVIVLFVALLPFAGGGAKFLYSNEASGQSQDIDSGRAQEGVLHILYLYLALSLICLFTFYFCGLSWIDAICQMATTLSTGGFSTRNGGIAAFNNPALEWALIVFMTIGGTSFFLMLLLLKGQFKKVFNNTELLAYFLLILMAATFVAGTTLTYDWVSSVRTALFQVVSILTTTGFTTVDYAQDWSGALQVLLLFLMIIGGCSGSTAGGLKVIRALLAFKIAQLGLERSYRARVRRITSMQGKNISESEESKVLRYIVLLLMTLALGVFLLAIFEPQLSLAGNLSAICASCFNVGPGLEELGPTQTYTFLKKSSKTLLACLMITGRLELYAILVLLTPTFWKKLS